MQWVSKWLMDLDLIDLVTLANISDRLQQNRIIVLNVIHTLSAGHISELQAG